MYMTKHFETNWVLRVAKIYLLTMVFVPCLEFGPFDSCVNYPFMDCSTNSTRVCKSIMSVQKILEYDRVVGHSINFEMAV